MIDLFKSMIGGQYEAVLCMFSACVDRCPDSAWDAPVVQLKYCQAVFHKLFFTDLYLGPDLDAIRSQAFHREHAATFADYEELEDRRQTASYARTFCRSYLAHCREKARNVVPAETAESLQAPAGFAWLQTSRAEVHLYNIRHVQHHAAQLGLHLRRLTGEGIPWVGSGWREL